MFIWLEALLASVFGSILLIIILCIIIRHRFRTKQQAVLTVPIPREASTKLPEAKPAPYANRRSSYHHMFRRGSSVKPLFNWADYPSLITDAVENGWSRFAFTNFASSPSVRSSLFGSLRMAGDHSSNSSNQVDMSWEVGHGSVDFMQRINFKKIDGSSSATGIRSTLVMALPLPGPPCSFPQEAYFEITVLSTCDDDGSSTVKINGGEGEKTKLIHQNISSSNNSVIEISEHRIHATSVSKGVRLIEEGKMSLGLAGAGSWTISKIPGSYSGSIGFNSNGSVYLGGMKLVFESEKEDWAQKGKIIGCGFDPRIRKVFFTVDSKLVREIYCKSEDFGTPLYPILTANTNITVLVNLGQSHFSYSPANSFRTPNPCFIGPIVNSAAPGLGYEDSRELFSMGRLDSEWLSHGATIRSTISNGSNQTVYYNGNKAIDCDEDSDADLFEIVLDNTRLPIVE